MTERVPAALARKIRVRANDQCEYCLLPQKWQEATFHIDHVKPRSRKGQTTLDNLALARVTCSLRKSAKAESRDPKSGQKVRLFNPRKDKWDNHFRLTTSFRIYGRTSRGRATVRTLGMNRPAIIAIRSELSKLPRRRKPK